MKKATLYFCILLFVFQFTLPAFSQKIKEIQSNGDYYHVYRIKAVTERSSEIILPAYITGLSIELAPGCSFGKSSISAGGQQYPVLANDHDEYQGKNLSFLISFEQATDRFELYNLMEGDSFLLHAYYAGTNPPPVKKKSFAEGGYDCSKPPTIDQSVWRDGLPAPKPNPEYTQTVHIIIHHTAGSNTITDHLTEIRNIYLYHTQTQGWDDIGYNFIIARDGTIYEGRDGQLLYEDDFVKGAHFCGKNANTMGISLLGTYTAIEPTPESMQSLLRLLLWKLHKDQLSVSDSFLHPQTGTDQIMLPRIAGHRDGCATECPGTAFYLTFPRLRQMADSLIRNCPALSLSESANTLPYRIFPNPAEDYLTISSSVNQVFSAVITDLNGKAVLHLSSEYNTLSFSLSSLPKGVYFVKITDHEGTPYVIPFVKNN